MKKTQISMEMIILLGFILVLTGPLILIYMTYTQETEFEMSQSQAMNIANKVADNAELMYYQGAPSKVTLKVSMPNNIENIEINPKDITFKLFYKGNPVDIVAVSTVNMTGSISHTQGIKYIEIEATSTGARISSS